MTKKKMFQKPSDLLGQKFGNWVIEEKLGSGGMATVYRSRHSYLPKKAAIKILHKELCEDETKLQRFRREAIAVGELHHKNIIQLLDFGFDEESESFFMVQELLEGYDLKSVIDQAPFPTSYILKIMEQVCSGIAATHNANFMHRDLKPANLFVLPNEAPNPLIKILDFGLTKIHQEGIQLESTGLEETSSLEESLTDEMSILGTFTHMAPEQITKQEQESPSMDIYSIGVILFQLFTGKLPFKEESAVKQIMSVAMRPPPLVGSHRPELSGTPLEDLINRLLAKNPQDRPAPIERVWKELQQAVRSFRDPLEPSSSGELFGIVGQNSVEYHLDQLLDKAHELELSPTANPSELPPEVFEDDDAFEPTVIHAETAKKQSSTEDFDLPSAMFEEDEDEELQTVHRGKRYDSEAYEETDGWKNEQEQSTPHHVLTSFGRNKDLPPEMFEEDDEDPRTIIKTEDLPPEMFGDDDEELRTVLAKKDLPPEMFEEENEDLRTIIKTEDLPPEMFEDDDEEAKTVIVNEETLTSAENQKAKLSIMEEARNAYFERTSTLVETTLPGESEDNPLDTLPASIIRKYAPKRQKVEVNEDKTVSLVPAVTPPPDTAPSMVAIIRDEPSFHTVLQDDPSISESPSPEAHHSQDELVLNPLKLTGQNLAVLGQPAVTQADLEDVQSASGEHHAPMQYEDESATYSESLQVFRNDKKIFIHYQEEEKETLQKPIQAPQQSPPEKNRPAYLWIGIAIAIALASLLLFLSLRG